MRNFITAGVALLLLASVIACFAGPKTTSFVGTWSMKSEGGVLVRGEKTSNTTHWEKQQSTIEGEIVITEQKGRVMYGFFTSKKIAKESFVGVIGNDNKIYFADADGFFEGMIINADAIEIVYRHVTPTDTVVSIGTWTRKK